jgi:cob(I)alamin adenosyltransferase
MWTISSKVNGESEIQQELRAAKMKTNDSPQTPLGLVQVYTGNGKGKTTAALGLAMRAAGAGFKVFIAQFVKGMDYSELHSFAALADQITIRQYGRHCFLRDKPEPEDVRLAQNGLREVAEAIASGHYRVVILDEATIAIHFALFTSEELLAVVESRPPHVEIVITGRYADEKIKSRADLVTEMREVKHYYRRGIAARTGIEC